MISSAHERFSHPRGDLHRALLGLVLCGALDAQAAPRREVEAVRRFPSLEAGHTHMAQLMENALAYFQPANRIIDPVSGYPREGWNQQPELGLYLRDYTQLTAIGLWLEVQAACASGEIVDDYWTRERALAGLELTARTLRHDQADPKLSDRGLLGNFLGLHAEGRLGPLASEVYRRDFAKHFDEDTTRRLWGALSARGWIQTMRDGEMASIRRPPGYGEGGFRGPLEPFADPAAKAAILSVLDQRVAQAVFGDNANLCASAAKTIGALSAPALRDDPAAIRVCAELDAFIDAQRAGFTALYDPGMRLFRFGWNATLQHYLGWANGDGDWQVAYSDYLVNEFRGPTQFVIARYGLPADGLANLGFHMKGWITADGRALHTLAPYDGSAFQSFGLSLCMGERAIPAWRAILENAADLELDYSRRFGLPGFLSESYTGRGTEYSARCGIPELAVAGDGRLTHAPSLYTLGIAHALRPEGVEALLAQNWAVISSLFTDHGPWEGYDVMRRRPVEFQTTPHTAALLLGALDTADRHMAAYLAGKGLQAAVSSLAPVSRPGGLLESKVRVTLWSPHGGSIRGAFEGGGYRLRGTKAGPANITFTYPSRSAGLDAAGLELVMRYHLQGPVRDAVIQLDRKAGVARAVPTELHLQLRETDGRAQEVRFPLPATPGLIGLREIVLRIGAGGPGLFDLRIERLELVAAGTGP